MGYLGASRWLRKREESWEILEPFERARSQVLFHNLQKSKRGIINSISEVQVKQTGSLGVQLEGLTRHWDAVAAVSHCVGAGKQSLRSLCEIGAPSS